MVSASALSKVHIACPNWLTENRVASDRLEDHPKCGKCGAALLEGKPLGLNEGSFEAFTGGKVAHRVRHKLPCPFGNAIRQLAPIQEYVQLREAFVPVVICVDLDQGRFSEMLQSVEVSCRKTY